MKLSGCSGYEDEVPGVNRIGAPMKLSGYSGMKVRGWYT